MSKPAAAAGAESERYRHYDELDRLEELLEDMAELGVDSAAAAEAKIVDLNRRIDHIEAGTGEETR